MWGLVASFRPIRFNDFQKCWTVNQSISTTLMYVLRLEQNRHQLRRWHKMFPNTNLSSHYDYTVSRCLVWMSSPQHPLTSSNPLQHDWLGSTPHFSQASTEFDSWGGLHRFIHSSTDLCRVSTVNTDATAWHEWHHLSDYSCSASRILWRVITRKGNRIKHRSRATNMPFTTQQSTK